MKKTFCLILSLCMMASVLVLPGCTKQDGDATPLFRGLDSGEMFLSGYIGPRPFYVRNGKVVWEPYKDGQIFQDLADAGLNYMVDELNFAGSTYEYAKKALEYSSEAGLMYFMAAYDVMHVGRQTMGTDAEIKAKLQELYQYDSFGGLFLIDEPSATSYPFIKDCIARLNQIEAELGYTDLNPHVNLLPPIAGGNRLSGTSESISWEDYIRGLSSTGMKYLSFDMYPIYGLFTNKVLPGWFTALGTMNQVAIEEGKPWIGCVQVGGGSWAYLSPEQRVTTEGELKWDVNTMLAFGAKGLIYYQTVSPPFWVDKEGAEEQKNWHSMINVYGEKTEFYDYVKEINAHISAMDHVLMNCDYKGVIVTGNTPCVHYGKDLIKSNSFRGLSDVTGNALVGCFDYNGKTALFVVNNSITEEGEISLTFDHKYNMKVTQDAVTRTENGNSLTLHLGIGESALVVLESRDLTTVFVIAGIVAAFLGVTTVITVATIRKRKRIWGQKCEKDF